MGNLYKIGIMSKVIVRLDNTLDLTGLRRREFRGYGRKEVMIPTQQLEKVRRKGMGGE